jgi:hypothetical protein
MGGGGIGNAGGYIMRPFPIPLFVHYGYHSIFELLGTLSNE